LNHCNAASIRNNSALTSPSVKTLYSRETDADLFDLVKKVALGFLSCPVTTSVIVSSHKSSSL